MENLGHYDAGVPFRKFIFVFLLVCVVVGAGVFYSALSRATITIIPKGTVKSVDTEVTVDGDLSQPDLDKGLLPGQILVREATGSQTDIEVQSKQIDEFARGKVLLHNNSPYVQGIKQGAGLHPVGAPNDVTFITANRVTLPPKASRTVDVVAVIKGAKGNLPPGKLEFLNLDNQYMRDNLWAENTDKIEGGTRQAQIVLDSDIANAENDLAKKMFKQTLDEMNKSLDSGNVIKPESAHYTYLEKSATVQPGSEAEKFNIQLKIQVQGVTINENDLKSIAENKIQSMAGSDEDFVREEPDSFNYSLTELDLDNKKALIKVEMRGLFNAKLSPRVFDKTSIVGYNEAAIREHFSHMENIADIKVSFWPPFRKTVPNVESGIDIGVKKE